MLFRSIVVAFAGLQRFGVGGFRVLGWRRKPQGLRPLALLRRRRCGHGGVEAVVDPGDETGVFEKQDVVGIENARSPMKKRVYQPLGHLKQQLHRHCGIESALDLEKSRFGEQPV